MDSLDKLVSYEKISNNLNLNIFTSMAILASPYGNFSSRNVSEMGSSDVPCWSHSISYPTFSVTYTDRLGMSIRKESMCS